PFDPVTPGVEIHATAVSNILDGRSLWSPGWLLPVEALVILLVAVLAPLAPPRIGAVWATVLVLGAIAAVLGGAHLAFRTGIWVPVLPFLLSLALAHVGSVT